MNDTSKGSGLESQKKKSAGTGMLRIDSLFSKRPKTTFDAVLDVETKDNHSSSPETSSSSKRSKMAYDNASNINAETTATPSAGPSTSSNVEVSSQKSSSLCSRFDIGDYIGKHPDDFIKRMLLQNHWKPPKNYEFPHSLHTKSGKQVKRFVGHQHLDNYHWLALSEKHQGLYCVYCVLFSPGDHGGNQAGSALNYFVKAPLKSFAKLTGKEGFLESHSRNKYHKDSVEVGQTFLRNYNSDNSTVADMICSQRKQQADENRDKLRRIVDTVIFCGRQNIPLRGHRDDGRIVQFDKETIENTLNEGNFRALLRLRMLAGDNILQEHLQKTASNALYTSKTIQNEVIECCKDEMQNQIIKRIINSGMYSIIFDETTDASHTEQASLSFRYLHYNEPREDFFCFIDAYNSIRDEDITKENGEKRLTGVALGHMVEDILESYSLDLSKCVGIGTDNCNVMKSTNSESLGAVATIQLKATNARRCPCFNHSLNSSLAKSCNVASCRNAMGTMKKVIQFANASAKRTLVFQNHLGSAFKGLCETRWSERHDGVLQFKSKLPEIINALEEIKGWVDKSTSSDAFCLKTVLESSEFLVSMIVLCDVLGTTRQLSVLLQSESLDLVSASESFLDVTSILDLRRQNAADHFKNLFSEVVNLGDKLNVAISAPRRTGRQQHRANTPTDTVEQYYLRSIYIPVLDYVISDIKERLPKETLECFGLSVFIPSNMHDYTNDSKIASSLAIVYKDFLNVPEETESFKMQHEYEAWKQKWDREKNKKSKLPATALQTLLECNKIQYPLIWTMLQILLTLPSSVATAERSFSTLRRLKTWLRTSMSEERLTGLALLHVHYDITVDIDNVIERFTKQKARRLNFII